MAKIIRRAIPIGAIGEFITPPWFHPITNLSVGFLRLTADCARRLILQSSLEILRHILRPEIGEFSIHLLYNTRYGR